MNRWRPSLGLWLLLALCPAGRVQAVMFVETGDPLFHTSTPGDNSGWQYEGNFGNFLGVPIAPYFFITAAHFGLPVGTVFSFHGDNYTTIAYHDSPPTELSPTTDLRIWEVAHSKPFPVYAPLATGAADIGANAAVFGRGKRRGTEVRLSGTLKGWTWGTSDQVERWGRNIVTGVLTDPALGELLYCEFNRPGVPGECHLATGDSGGGLFVLENGLWRLAGIHYSVDGPYRTGAGAPSVYCLFDTGGMEVYQGSNTWTLIPDQTEDLPSRFYSSRIAPSLPWITSIAPEAAALAPENFSAWQRLYFTPAQIATPATTGPLADFDGDGIPNLIEFALNLDPVFRERVTMTATTGLRGLPVVQLVPAAGGQQLGLELVRRTSNSGAGLTYIVEFSSDLVNWQEVGTTNVTSINPRWDRVQVVDALTTGESARRFGRLRVTMAD